MVTRFCDGNKRANRKVLKTNHIRRWLNCECRKFAKFATTHAGMTLFGNYLSLFPKVSAVVRTLHSEYRVIGKRTGSVAAAVVAREGWRREDSADRLWFAGISGPPGGTSPRSTPAHRD